MKKVAYFSHDADARRDPKMTALIGRYGMAGYGSFWVIIELLREQEEYRLPHKPWAYQAIAAELKTEIEKTKEFIQDLIKNFELFKSDGKNFWSKSLMDRMAMMEIKREKTRNAARKRWDKERCKSNADAY